MRYKSKTYRKKKFRCKAPNVQCGRRCFPPGTKCREDEKPVAKPEPRREPKKPYQEPEIGLKQKVEASVTEITPMKLLAAGAVVLAAGGAVAYVIHKDKQEMVPFNRDNEPQSTRAKASVRSVDARSDSPDTMEYFDNKKPVVTHRLHPEESIDQTPDFEDKMVKRRQNARATAQKWAQDALNDPDLVILDLETTALFKNADPYDPSTWKNFRADVPGIFQMSFIEGNMDRAYDIKMNPEKKLSAASAAITGTKQEEFYDKLKFKEAYPFLKKRLENKRVLAFNSRFDLQVLDALCVENDLPVINFKNRPVTPERQRGMINPPTLMDNDSDMMHWAGLYIGKLPRKVGDEYGIEKGLVYTQLPTLPGARAHDALSDVYSTYDVLRRMALGLKPIGLKRSENEIWESTT